MARKSKQVTELQEILGGQRIEEAEALDVKILVEIRSELTEVSDPRDASYVRHSLADVILIVLLAVLSNADEWKDIEIFARSKEKWLRGFLELEYGIPTDDCFRVVISRLNVKTVYSMITGYLIKKIMEMQETKEAAEEKDIISCDGKVSKSSKREETEGRKGSQALNTLNAYSNKLGCCLDQEFIGEKTNEIPAMPVLLNRLVLRGTIVTWDALNTQKDTVEAVMAGKGDYVGALKGNQHNFYGEVQDYFDEEVKKGLAEGARIDYGRRGLEKAESKGYKKTVEKEHSAIVTREYYLSTDIRWLTNKEKWAGLKAIGLAEKTVEKLDGKGTVIKESRYYIASVDDIEDFSRAVRSHWGVENGLHWHLDYTFKDDHNTTTRDNGAEGLQLFKKMALLILKVAQAAYPKGTSLKNIRYKLSLNYETEIVKIFNALMAK